MQVMETSSVCIWRFSVVGCYVESHFTTPFRRSRRVNYTKRKNYSTRKQQLRKNVKGVIKKKNIRKKVCSSQVAKGRKYFGWWGETTRRVLLARLPQQRSTFPSRWSGVSGDTNCEPFFLTSLSQTSHDCLIHPFAVPRMALGIFFDGNALRRRWYTSPEIETKKERKSSFT